jgi:hypothetical protein
MGDGEGRDEHPKLKVWKRDVVAARSVGDNARVNLYRPQNVLGYRSATIYLEIVDTRSAVISSRQDDWDAGLDAGLLDLGVRAISKENEGQRFNLILQAAFTPLEDRYGDAVFNAAFVDYLNDVADSTQLREMLKYSTALGPNKDSPSYLECRDGIESAVLNRGRGLHLKLKYSVDETNEILTAALLQNTDERFSVSNRKRMGLL